jgi:hypothetical protein
LLPGRGGERACARQKALALARTPLSELWRHPLHTREMGSQITNVLRCLYLEAMGYQVTVTELVGWEHSMKNELILARRTGQRKRSAAERLRAILARVRLAVPLRAPASSADIIGVRTQLIGRAIGVMARAFPSPWRG